MRDQGSRAAYRVRPTSDRVLQIAGIAGSLRQGSLYRALLPSRDDRLMPEDLLDQLEIGPPAPGAGDGSWPSSVWALALRARPGLPAS
jgi:hypothetical protein